MSSCSQIFSDEALLRRVQEMAQSLSDLGDLRRRVREAEARALPKRRQSSLSPPRQKQALVAATRVDAVR